MATTPSEPAYPCAMAPDWPECDRGMTLRDYFAGQALIGVLSSRNGFLIDVGVESAPGWAFQIADAMLAERDK